ncbi:MAG: hypothetical protein ACYDHG_06735 [Desulfomonilaceae bacterium]
MGFVQSVSNATRIGSTNTRRITDTPNVTIEMIIAIINACSSRHAVILLSIVGGLVLSY